MEINNFISELKKKYNYSEELILFIQKAIPALIKHFGADKKDVIYGTFLECEIHIQRDNEDHKKFLNEYFGTQEEWELAPHGEAFYTTELSLKDNIVHSKSIIYVLNRGKEKNIPIDLNDDKIMTVLIHEICHAIKGYRKISIEQENVIVHTGLSSDVYQYDPATASFKLKSSNNTGIEEALNSNDEEEVMTLITGVPHENGGYKDMQEIIKQLLKHKELAHVIRISQFTGANEWRKFLGEENSEFLIRNFEDYYTIGYGISTASLSFSDFFKLFAKRKEAYDNLQQFAKNYNTPSEYKDFIAARTEADNKTITTIIQYNPQTGKFESGLNSKK